MTDGFPAVARPGVTGSGLGNGPTGTGKTVAALVVGHDRAGAAILQTADGRMTLASATPLAPGTRLTLLVGADGSVRELTARPPLSGPAGVADAAGDLVRLGATPAGAIRQLPEGTILRAEIVDRFPQQGSGPPMRQDGRAGAIRPGEVVVLRLVSATTPEGSEIPGSRLLPSFVARTLGGGEHGRLSSPFGTLQLAQLGESDLTGQLSFRLVGLAARPGAGGGALGEPAVLGKAWPAMSALLGQLDEAQPAMAALLRKDLPEPGENFAGRVIRFVLGMDEEAPDARLSRLFSNLAGHPESRPLLDRVGDDLQRYARWAEPGSEWRTFVVPVADGKDLLPFHLYVRDGKGRNRVDDAESGVRFLVDVDMSRLGALQLDGLYRRRHLSLAVRGRRRLPPAFGEGVRDIFDRALLAAGMTGELRIESEAAFDPAPLGSVLGKQPGMAI